MYTMHNYSVLYTLLRIVFSERLLIWKRFTARNTAEKYTVELSIIAGTVGHASIQIKVNRYILTVAMIGGTQREKPRRGSHPSR